MDRVMITMPNAVRTELDEAAGAIAENRSEFVRRAVVERIERLRLQRFEGLLAEAYRAGNVDNATDVRSALGLQDAAAGTAWLWDE